MLLVAWAGCKQQADAPAVTADRPVLPASEISRGRDACQAYVASACACAATVPALAERCALARALPEAIDVSLSVATNPESSRRDVVQANDSVRKVVKECIEQTAKLPAAGCP